MEVVAYERLLVTIREYDDAWPLVAAYLTQRLISAAPAAEVVRDDPALRAEYAALKRSIVQGGADDPVPYSTSKDEWLAQTLLRLGLPPTPAAFGG